MKESSDKKDLHAIERLANNLVNRSEEVRERSASSLLLKLELKIIPKDILLGHYHYIIGRCLECLNEHLTSLKSKTIQDLITILSYFAECQTGKDILRRYGTVEFMSQLLEYVRKEKNGAIVDQIENFLKGFFQSGQLVTLETKALSRAQTIIESTLNKKPNTKKSQKVSRCAIQFKRIFEDLDNEINLSSCLNFRLKNFGLIDQEKTFLIELTTQLRFTDKKDIKLGSALGMKVLSAVRSFPVEIYFSQHYELFIEIFKLAVETDDQQLSTGLFVQIMDAFVHQTNTNRRLGNEDIRSEFNSHEAKSYKAVEGFLENMYPPLNDQKADHDHMFRQKLTLENICELILRSFVALKFDNGHSLLICEKMCAFIDFIAGNVKSFKGRDAISRLLFQIAQFYEVTLLGSFDKDSSFELSTIGSLCASRITLKIFITIYGLYLQAKPAEKPWAKIKFDFKRLVSWSADGLYSTEELDELQAILNDSDHQSAKELMQFRNLQDSAAILLRSCEQEQQTSASNFASLLTKIISCGDSVKALFASQVEIGPFIELFSIAQFLISKSELNTQLTIDQSKKCEEYLRGFMQHTQILLFVEHMEEQRISFLSSLKLALKEKRKMTIPLKISPDKKQFTVLLSDLLIEAINKSHLMNLILLSVMESESSSPLIITLVLELLAEVFASISDIDLVCDPFILANFIVNFAEENKTAASLQSFLCTRSPFFNKLSLMVRLGSKDIFGVYQTYYALALGTQSTDSTFNPENSLVKPKLTNNHPYFGLLDESGQNRTLRSELEVLGSLQTTHQSYLKASDLKDLYEILSISANEAIDREIRRGALQQIFEALISVRNNREAKDFSSTVANLAFERLFKCELGSMTDIYVKILLAFLLHHSFHSNLKLRMIENLRGLCRTTEFRPLTRLLEACLTSPDKQFKLNSLALIQIAVSASNVWESKFLSIGQSIKPHSSLLMPHSNQRLLQTMSEDSPLSDSDKDSLKIAVIKMNANHMHNFLGVKPAAHGPLILQRVGCNSQVIGKFIASSDLSSVKSKIIIGLIEDKLRSAKNLCLSNSKSLDITLPIHQIDSLTLLFRTLESSISNNVQKLDLLEGINKFNQDLLPKITSLSADKTTVKLFAVALADLSLSLSPIDFGESDSSDTVQKFSAMTSSILGPIIQSNALAEKEVFDNLTPALFCWNSFAKAHIAGFLSHTERINQISCLPLSKESSTQILEALGSPNIKLNSQKTLNFFTDSIHKTALGFTHASSYLELRTKSTFLNAVHFVLSSGDHATIISNYDHYLRAKELTKSNHTELRLRAWNAIFMLTRRLSKETDSNLASEILFKCNEHLSGFIDNEFIAVNDQLISIAVCLLQRHHSQIEEDGAFRSDVWRELVKKLSKKCHRFSLSGLAGLLSLARIVGADSSILHPIFEYIAKFVLSYQQIQVIDPSKAYTNDIEEQSQKLMKSNGQDLNMWLLDQFVVTDNESNFKPLGQLSRADPGIIPTPMLKVSLDLIVTSSSIDTIRQSHPLLAKSNSRGLKRILKEFSVFSQSLLLVINELLGNAFCGTEESTTNKKSKSVLPPIFASKLINAYQFFCSSFFHSTGQHCNGLLETVLARISQTVPKLPGVSGSDITQLVLNTARILDAYQFNDVSLQEACLASACFCIRRLKQATAELNVDSLCLEDKSVPSILIAKISQKIGQIPSRLWNYRQPLNWLLASSAHAKRAFLSSSLPALLQREIGLIVSEKLESEGATQLLHLLKSLFYPLNKSKYSLCKLTKQDGLTTKEGELFSKGEIEGLKVIYLTLAKTYTAGAEEPVYDVMTNWCLNKTFSPFIEALTVKGKNFIVDKAIETAKESRTFRESSVVLALRFLKSVACVEFVANYIVKMRLPFSLCVTMTQLYLADKRDQLIALNLKSVTAVIELLLALSFNRATHLKLLEGGKEHFETLRYFYSQCKSNELIKKFEVLFSNLLITKTIKTLFVEWPELVKRMQKLLILSSDPAQQLLASQFFYNFVYKDASTVALIDKNEFTRELELISSETKTAIDQSNDSANSHRLNQLLKNIRTIREILMAV